MLYNNNICRESIGFWLTLFVVRKWIELCFLFMIGFYFWDGLNILLHLDDAKVHILVFVMKHYKLFI